MTTETTRPAESGRSSADGEQGGRWRLGVGVLAGAGALSCGVGLMATSGWLISRAAEHPPVLYLMVAIVGVRAFGLGRGVLRYAERLIAHDAALRLLARARVRIYKRLAALTPGGLPVVAQTSVGGVLGVVVSAVEGVAERWLRGLMPMAVAAVAGPAAVLLEWWLLPEAGWVLAISLLVGGVLTPLLALWTVDVAERRACAARTELATVTLETLQGVPELVAYGAVPARLHEVRRWDRLVSAAALRSAWVAGAATALTALSCGAAVLGALAAGTAAVRGGRLDPVLLAVLVLVPLAAFESVTGLGEAARQLRRSRAEGAVLRELESAGEPVPVGGLPVPATGSEIVLRGVRARWPGGRVVELPDLELRAGRRVALLGPSGAGKSTLAAVLLRFLEYEGSVTLGGVELRDLDGDEVRRVVGVCGQDAHLFDTTVGENVRLAKPECSDAEAAAALRRAGLPGLGLRTPVGEHGRAVSGGEHRRIALARALLADFPVLILDEPDAHLDEATADALMADVLRAAAGRSVLLITHRAAFPGDHPVLRLVDEVVVLT